MELQHLEKSTQKNWLSVGASIRTNEVESLQ